MKGSKSRMKNRTIDELQRLRNSNSKLKVHNKQLSEELCSRHVNYLDEVEAHMGKLSKEWEPDGALGKLDGVVNGIAAACVDTTRELSDRVNAMAKQIMQDFSAGMTGVIDESNQAIKRHMGSSLTQYGDDIDDMRFSLECMSKTSADDFAELIEERDEALHRAKSHHLELIALRDFVGRVQKHVARREGHAKRLKKAVMPQQQQAEIEGMTKENTEIIKRVVDWTRLNRMDAAKLADAIVDEVDEVEDNTADEPKMVEQNQGDDDAIEHDGSGC